MLPESDMPLGKNERKTLAAFQKRYGAKGRGYFYGRINSARFGRASGGKKGSRNWIKALGRGAVNAASSGGRGRAYRARHPLRRHHSTSRRRR